MGVNLSGRSFLKLLDLTTEEIEYLLKLSKNFKDMKRAGVPHRYLEGKNIVLLFQKTSTRTRCAFEVGAMDLGMGVTYLDPGSSQMGKKESIEDTARVLGRFYDGIEFRGFAQSDVEELAEKAGLSLFTLRSYEQGKRMPRAKQMEALCEALGVTGAALTRHYFGSPNQAMHCMFAIAGAANLAPENDQNAGPRLRTQGNMVEWAFVCLTDKLEELKGKPTPERHDELTHWLATFDCTDGDTMRNARAAGSLNSNNAKLLPKA